MSSRTNAGGTDANPDEERQSTGKGMRFSDLVGMLKALHEEFPWRDLLREFYLKPCHVCCGSASSRCQSCGKRACHNCMTRCGTCNRQVCKTCLTTCRDCQKDGCGMCIGDCRYCGKQICSACGYDAIHMCTCRTCEQKASDRAALTERIRQMVLDAVANLPEESRSLIARSLVITPPEVPAEARGSQEDEAAKRDIRGNVVG